MKPSNSNSLASASPSADDEIFRLIAEETHEYAIFLLDNEGHIKTWTPAAQRIKGYSPDEIIGRHFSTFYTPQDRQKNKPTEALRTAREHGQFQDEGWRLRKDGSRLWASVTLTCLRDACGVPVGFSKITRDLSERRAIEEERDAFFNTSLDLMCIAGFDGCFKRVNPAFTRVLGYTEKELTSRPWLDFVHPDDVAATDAQGRKNFEGQTAIEFENRYRTKDGVYRWLSWIAVPSLQSKLIYAVARDVTDRRAAEDNIRRLNDELTRRAAELEATTKELEAFSYSVSHDLRAPLRSLDGFSQAILEDYGSKLDAEGQDYLRRIRAASQRMGQLIDDLLNLSRMTRVEMSRQPVDLSSLARQIIAELRSADPTRQVDVVIPDGLTAQADPPLIRIVLVNLLNNAWKFTAHSPSPRIEVGVTDIDGAHPFFVRDNGAGFDMAYADKLFGAFQRLHAVGDFPGTGIGLATVQRIVHRHGGRIWAEAAVGKGATFYFTL